MARPNLIARIFAFGLVAGSLGVIVRPTPAIALLGGKGMPQVEHKSRHRGRGWQRTEFRTQPLHPRAKASLIDLVRSADGLVPEFEAWAMKKLVHPKRGKPFYTERDVRRIEEQEKTLLPEQVSYVESFDELLTGKKKRKGLLRVIRGQGFRYADNAQGFESVPLAIPHYGPEVLDREQYPFVWEFGRARFDDPRHTRTMIGAAALAAYRDFLAFRPQGFAEYTPDIKEAAVVVWTKGQERVRDYEQYGFRVFKQKDLPGEDGEKEYWMMAPLQALIKEKGYRPDELVPALRAIREGDPYGHTDLGRNEDVNMQILENIARSRYRLLDVKGEGLPVPLGLRDYSPFAQRLEEYYVMDNYGDSSSSERDRRAMQGYKDLFHAVARNWLQIPQLSQSKWNRRFEAAGYVQLTGLSEVVAAARGPLKYGSMEFLRKVLVGARAIYRRDFRYRYDEGEEVLPPFAFWTSDPQVVQAFAFFGIHPVGTIGEGERAQRGYVLDVETFTKRLQLHDSQEETHPGVLGEGYHGRFEGGLLRPENF
jgi:hypothetical protein